MSSLLLISYVKDITNSYTVFILTLSSILVIVLLMNKRRNVNIDVSRAIVVVTGCDTGFGKLCINVLLNLNVNLIITCMIQDNVKYYNDRYHKKLTAVKLDVRNDDDVQSLKILIDMKINQEDLYLWCLVNNAGIAPIGLVDYMSMESFKVVMDINYFGLINLTKILLPQLKRVRDSRIVNISSMAGLTSGNLFGAYSGSKHALEGYSKALREELYPWNIHVCNINPGFCATPMLTTSITEAYLHYDKASKELQDQYNRDALRLNKDTVLSISESPLLVVDKIKELVLKRSPSLNNYVGWQAFLLNLFLLFPRSFQEIFTFRQNNPIGPTALALKKIQTVETKSISESHTSH